MTRQERSEAFDLARFVLGYLEHQGSLVAPAVYGVHEVLLPDELAARLQVESYLRLAFRPDAAGDAPLLSVNHPLVEAIADRLAQETGDAQVYMNHVRLEKQGLYELAAKTLRFPNARLSARRDAMQQAALHHYLRLNFKATFLTDEKQEQILSVVLDVQSGYAVEDDEVLERLVYSESEPAFPKMAVARPRWADAGEALAPNTLQALLPRGQAAAEAVLRDRLAALQSRTQRLLELDRARLEEYYDSMERDLQRRLDRADTAEGERRGSIESKITALHAEHSAKLADVQARYQLRVDLELINALIIAQPKVLLPVDIGNRRVTIARPLVYDPLVHRLEPLVCDVCGKPGEDLHLCTGGHLAHRRCLAPQCIECNREYCNLCADQLLVCVVCQQPVCRASLQHCPACGRGTCDEHQTLCHAADGKPVSLQEIKPAAKPAPPPAPPPPKPPALPKPSAPPPAKRPQPAPPQRAAPPPPTSAVRAVKLNVEVSEDMPRIVAFVMRSTSLVLATRSIELTPKGIEVICRCEKTPCPADGWLHRPADPARLGEQLQSLLTAVRQEYYLPPKRVYYYYMRGNDVTDRRTFVLPQVWQNEERLAEARDRFDRRSRRR